MSKAMIWGAGGAIGLALAEELTAQGWDVIGVARDSTSLPGKLWLPIEADVSDEFSVRQALLTASHEAESIALWIYAAGDITSATVREMPLQTWKRIMDANLHGAYMATHHSLPLLAPDATLVYLGAVNERLRLPGLSAYAAAKAGLEAFAESLRKEERMRRVLVVRPAAVDTALWDKVPMRVPKNAAHPQKVAQRIIEAYTLGSSDVLDLT